MEKKGSLGTAEGDLGQAQQLLGTTGEDVGEKTQPRKTEFTAILAGVNKKGATAGGKHSNWAKTRDHDNRTEVKSHLQMLGAWLVVSPSPWGNSEWGGTQRKENQY